MDVAVSRIASAIGEPARARMLFCLMDNRARTSTELAIHAEVSPSTASVHLQRLATENLVKVYAQGKHRYYTLNGRKVARVLEGLSVLAGAKFVPNTPNRLRAARTCYDHMAGTAGVDLYDQIQAAGWLTKSYEVTSKGIAGFKKLGINTEELKSQRRRFAYPCLDWSERRPHLAGSLGASLLQLALKKKWVTQDADSRALTIEVPYALGRAASTL